MGKPLSRLLTWGLLLVLAGLAGSPGRAAAAQADPAARQTPAPQRIVSLLPSHTETVCALGACDRLVGVDRHSNHPASVQRLPRLGGLEDPRLEALLALKPDLVLAPKSWRGLESLQRLGLPVLALEPTTLEQTEAAMVQIALALGLSVEQGQATWLALQKPWQEAAGRIPLRWRNASVYVEVSTVPHAASAGSFIGQMLHVIGLRSVIPATLGPFPRLNPEAVLKADPDWIVASHEGLASMRQRPALRELRALREGRTCGFDPKTFDLLLRPGPRLGNGALAIANCLAQTP